MKRLVQGISMLLIIGVLMAMLPPNEVTVESVTEQLESIDTLQEMQDARKNYIASDTYKAETAAEHEQLRADYEQYIADMTKAREEAAESLAALTEEEKAQINPALIAKITDTLSTEWRDLSDTISEGDEDYQYEAVYPAMSYEMSNHMVSTNGGVNNEIPQTLILVDTYENAGEWTPSGEYSFGTSNYEVVYCSDALYLFEDGVLYKRVNLEDSTYYDDEAAKHIRAIVSNSYPYLSLDQMKDKLAAANFENAEELTRSDVIAAVQLAIWNYSNSTELPNDYEYSRTFDFNLNPRWGKGYHDYTNELWSWWSAKKGHLTVDSVAGDRVNRLAQYLTNLEAESANTNQVVINKLTIEGAEPVQAKVDAYNVALKVKLNNGGTSEQDEIVITAKTASQVVTEEVNFGVSEYDMVIEAKAGETIEVVVEGKQILPKGAYLYEPKPADTNGDGVETSREVSQILVGVAEGLTLIKANASITLDIPETNPITADLKIQKTDETGAPLAGAAFDLYFISEETTYNIGTYAVDENGMLVVEDLLPGNYKLEESIVTEGYVKPETPITFTISEQGVIDVTETYDAKYVDGVLTIRNYSTSFNKMGSLTIEKVDSATGRVLEGAIFTLKGSNYEESLTTDRDGKVIFSDLPFGKYTLTESKAPKNYKKDETQWLINVGINEKEQRHWVMEVENKRVIIPDIPTVDPIDIDSLTIEKTVDKNEVTVGDTVTYTIVVTNTGKQTLMNVTVKDELIGLDTVIAQLAANASKTFTGQYVVTEENVGELKNIAIASIEVDGEMKEKDASTVVQVTEKEEDPGVTEDEDDANKEEEDTNKDGEDANISNNDETPEIEEDSEVKEDTNVTTDVQVSEKDEVTENVVVEEDTNVTNNPKTGENIVRPLIALTVFLVAGAGIFLYRRKLRG